MIFNVPGLIFKKAEPNQSEHLTDLALRSKSIWGYEEDYLTRCRPALYLSPDYINEWPVVVCEYESKPIGFFALKFVDGENRLDHLWMDPEFIRKGFGSLLFKKAILEAEKLGWKSFRLAADPPAEGFYLKMNAKTIGSVQSRIKPDLFLPHMEYIIR